MKSGRFLNPKGWSAAAGFIMMLLGGLPAGAAGLSPDSGPQAVIRALEVPFVENLGQAGDEGVRYFARTFGGTVAVTNRGEIRYVLPRAEGKRLGPAWGGNETFLDGLAPQVSGQEETQVKLSWFKGRDASLWCRNLSAYRRVGLGKLYDGIECTLAAGGRNVEKLFTVYPGALPEKILVRVGGARGLSVSSEGELVVDTGLGTVKFTKPFAYQNAGAARVPVRVSYNVSGNTYGFNVGAYDRTKALMIDPLLASTFLGGGADDDWPFSMDLDSDGNVYVTGYTRSADFPAMVGAYSETLAGSYDVFVAKFDGGLQSLLAATVYGGEDGDEARSIKIDSSGNVYIAGLTGSDDLPTTPGAFQPSHREGRVGTDAFVAKFDSDLQSLLAATYLSGSDGGAEDRAYALDLGGDGSVYVAGYTDSPNFPVTAGSYDPNHGGDPGSHSPGGKVFVAKLNADLSALQAGTFLGAPGGGQSAYAVAVDGSGNVFVGGQTGAAEFPVTEGAYDTSLNNGSGKSDIFIAKFDGGLQNLLAATFLGGSESDTMGYDRPQQTDRSMAFDGDGNIYITGITSSPDFPVTAGAFRVINEYGASFVSKLDSNLESLLASTFLCLGVSRSLVIDASGSVCVAGNSEYACPTPVSAYQTDEDQWGGAYIIKLDSDLKKMEAATFIGGSERDTALSIAADGSENIYISGWTQSADFPVTEGAHDTTFNSAEGQEDAFIAKFDKDLSRAGAGSDNATAGESCPLEAAVPDRAHLEMLRALRDKHLMRSAADLVALYYSRAPEITEILSRRPAIKKQLNQIICSRMDTVRQLLAVGRAVLDRQAMTELTGFLTALQQHASPDLKAELAGIITGITSGGLLETAGVTVR